MRFMQKNARFLMKVLMTWAALVLSSFVLITPASAHDVTNAGTWQPEQAYTFTHRGVSYAVWNTHVRNFLGNERIEIRKADGSLLTTWWTRRGWCFTQEAYLAQECMSHGNYERYFVQMLPSSFAAVQPAVNLIFSGGAGRKSVLDSYPCIENRLSSNTPASSELSAPDC